MRRGISQPRYWNLPPLRLGTRIRLRFGSEVDIFPAMISAIVSEINGTDLFLVVTPHSSMPTTAEEVSASILKSNNQTTVALGSLLPISNAISKQLSYLGFRIIRLRESPLDFLSIESTIELSCVRDFRRNLWSGGNFRVRRINPMIESEGLSKGKRAKSNRVPVISNVRGRVSSEATCVNLEIAGETLHFPFCGLVSRSGKRLLTDDDSLGAPLISSRGALAAVVVGASEDETLVLPFEEIQRITNFRFRSFGEDWPKVLVRET